MENVISPVSRIHSANENFLVPIPVPQPFITKILTPYKANAKYLYSANIETINEPAEQKNSGKQHGGIIIGNGIFSIPSSCYIDDTGHFNSVEFNICYNQLAYVLFGSCLEADLFKKIIPLWQQKTDLCYDIFIKNQLSSMYIAKIDGKFMKPMDARKFYGKLTVNRVLWTHNITFFDTAISFSDDQGEKATGNVLLAYNSHTNN